MIDAIIETARRWRTNWLAGRRIFCVHCGYDSCEFLGKWHADSPDESIRPECWGHLFCWQCRRLFHIPL